MVSVIITILAISGAISYFLFSWTLIYNKRPPSIDYYKLSKQGPPVFNKNCACSISNTVCPGNIQVFKSGILFKPYMTRNCLLTKNEINYFTTSFNNSYTGTEIVHTSPYLKSPLIVYTVISEEIKKLFK